MIANVVIGGAIFAYAGWMFVRHVKKSSQGTCASCSMADGCHGSCGTYEHRHKG
ncbi:FeoB-associated Cys-rich membrane protein [Thermaerobacillus caldiproteolyticus]|nr:FeoB-associated Cys-rich membrane protein [Anoxybacillus caldiproteolyticus]QPA33118.1 FeoB-associated Cys-rich membrane protein [Anoxybacillus caldiproteolyticus]